MIIDFHTHIFPANFLEDRERYLKQDSTFRTLFSKPGTRLTTDQELVEAMDAAKVDMAVVMGVGWTSKDVAREANDYIIQAVKRFPSRLVGFCSVNPAWGEDAVSEVERCAWEGIKGIGELHPDTQAFDLTSKGVMAPLMEAASDLGLIVLCHSSEPVGHLYPGKGSTTPEKLYVFINNFPANTIVCAHWGGGLPFYNLMPEVAEASNNVFYDTAASPFLYQKGVFPAVVDLVGAERVLFGTDFPLLGQTRLLNEVQDSLITCQAKTDILERNAQTLLGI